MHSKTFFAEVSRFLACDAQRAEALTTVVLQELHHRLTEREARDVAAQLPKDLRRIWDEVSHGDHPPERVHRQEFIGRVRNRAVLPADNEAERAVTAVFHTLQRALGSAEGIEGEAGHIFSQLPKDLKTLWLEAAHLNPPPTAV